MGQASAICRPECHFSACRNVEHEATGHGDLEVVVRDGGDGRPSSLGGGYAAQGGHVTVQQQSCIAGLPQHRLQEVQLVVQKRWSDGSTGGLTRSRLLAPHLRLRFSDYYEVGKKLGEGSFGDVHEAMARPVDPQTGSPPERAEGDVAGGSITQGAPAPSRSVAVKIFRLSRSSDSSARAKSQANRKHDNLKKSTSFEAERHMLATLEHPHIIRMHECYQESSALFIVLELCRGGELYSRLVARAREVGTGLEEPLSKHLFRQMLYAVGYLHTRQIVHRDIKTENFLLLGERGSPEGDTLKLCDFGTSTMLTTAQPRCMENIGTLSYTAPEVYMNKGAAVPSDCWSLGVVLYVVLTGTNPFRVPGRKVDREETIRRIRHCDFERGRQSWLNLSEEAKGLIQQLLVLEEDKRLTCHEALVDAWVAGAVRPSAAVALAAHAPNVAALLLRVPRLAVVQRIALECCAVAVSEADLQTSVPWRELFLALDADQDGCLSFKELSQGLVHLSGGGQVRPEQLEEAARALDLDGSGAIEWVEWLAVAILGAKGVAEAAEPLSTAFRLVDRSLLHGGGGGGPAEDDAQAEEASGPEVGLMISEWVPSSRAAAGQGLAGMSAGSAAGFMLEDLRFVLSSMEAHENL